MNIQLNCFVYSKAPFSVQTGRPNEGKNSAEKASNGGDMKVVIKTAATTGGFGTARVDKANTEARLPSA